MKIIAHRGSSGTHPENTLPAFAEAVRIGADGIELDVQLTKDQQLVVMHDEEVNRTTDGKGAIASKTLAEIKQLNAGSWFDEKYTSTKVPTLKEVLDLLVARSFRGFLEVELKTDKEAYPGIEEKVSELMTSQEWPFTYGYSSFNLKSLAKIAELEPDTQIDFTCGKIGKKAKAAVEESFIKGLHPDMRWIKEHLLETEKIALPIRPWTVNEEEDIECCVAWQFAGIFTDFPERALAVKKK